MASEDMSSAALREALRLAAEIKGLSPRSSGLCLFQAVSVRCRGFAAADAESFAWREMCREVPLASHPAIRILCQLMQQRQQKQDKWHQKTSIRRCAGLRVVDAISKVHGHFFRSVNEGMWKHP